MGLIADASPARGCCHKFRLNRTLDSPVLLKTVIEMMSQGRRGGMGTQLHVVARKLRPGGAGGESYGRSVQFRPMIYLAFVIDEMDGGCLESVTRSN